MYVKVKLHTCIEGINIYPGYQRQALLESLCWKIRQLDYRHPRTSHNVGSKYTN